MAICSNCGVELNDNTPNCPLCGQNLTGITDKDAIEQLNRQIMPQFVSEIEPLNPKQKARLAWEIATLMLFSAVVVVLFVDLVANRQITWSVYPIIVTGTVWILASLVSFFYKSLVVLFLGGYIDLLLLLFLVDVASRRLPWFAALGLPITSCFFLIIGVLGLIAPRITRRGLNIPAFMLFGIGLFCMGIEATIDWYFFSTVEFSWSALVTISVSPVAIILLFVHYRLRKYVDLKRFFHL
ncbi:MAG: zinc ribbon domain-containing protein [Spirochaetales bacterium]|jgi:hypothetical protein|nr:zinc ribbon domain-containing protein [Spirochaetales bacterium]